ncbi:hypothetical protein ACR79M_13780 [Sphingobacterium spiritivorum]|uniref:hypothetical protein n=1 Tax=Sphingobacterium TaxID=28453 RepID=UPI0025D9AA95|nr:MULTISPECIES: hypothetical protein [unclassified Sphingobacterium]
MKVIQNLFFAFLSLLLFSCEKSEEKQSSAEPVTVSLMERADGSAKTLHLINKTVKIFNCGNYYLHSDFKLQNATIVLNYYDVKSPEVCLTSLGPAVSQFDLVSLENKSYPVEVNIGGQQIKGKLEVTASDYTLTLPEQQMVKVLSPKLNRLPANVIFGFVRATKEKAAIVDQFLADLQNKGAAAVQLPSGKYTMFEVDNTGKVIMDLSGYNLAKPFALTYQGDVETLKTLVKSYKTTHGTDFDTEIRFSDGTEIYSFKL